MDDEKIRYKWGCQ